MDGLVVVRPNVCRQTVFDQMVRSLFKCPKTTEKVISKVRAVKLAKENLERCLLTFPL
jgi:hypothetical protein